MVPKFLNFVFGYGTDTFAVSAEDEANLSRR